MPTGGCQHMGRGGILFPKHQTTKFMHEKILISYLVLVKEYKACCPGCGGCAVGFFLIPCTIGFCQCCSGRPWTSFDVSSRITIYNSHWVGHMGSRDEYSPCLTTQKCFSQVHPRFQPLLLRKKPGDINWLPCRNPHSERAKESLRWMNSSSHLETEMHSPGEVSLGLLSPLWNPKLQDPTYLHACMMLASPPACHLL